MPQPEKQYYEQPKAVPCITKTAPQEEVTNLSADGAYTFVTKVGKAASDAGAVTLLTGSMEKIVKDYNAFKGVSDYSLLPSANYTFEGSNYTKGATEAEGKTYHQKLCFFWIMATTCSL